MHLVHAGNYHFFLDQKDFLKILHGKFSIKIWIMSFPESFPQSLIWKKKWANCLEIQALPFLHFFFACSLEIFHWKSDFSTLKIWKCFVPQSAIKAQYSRRAWANRAFQQIESFRIIMKRQEDENGARSDSQIFWDFFGFTGIFIDIYSLLSESSSWLSSASSSKSLDDWLDPCGPSAVAWWRSRL